MKERGEGQERSSSNDDDTHAKDAVKVADVNMVGVTRQLA